MRVWRGVEANVRQGMTARAVAGVAAVVALGGGCGGGLSAVAGQCGG